MSLLYLAVWAGLGMLGLIIGTLYLGIAFDTGNYP